jgi:hypothetical protein
MLACAPPRPKQNGSPAGKHYQSSSRDKPQLHPFYLIFIPTLPLYPALHPMGLGITAIRVGFAIAAADGLIDLDTGKIRVDFAAVDTVVFDGFSGFVASGGQAEQGSREKNQVLHVFSD